MQTLWNQPEIEWNILIKNFLIDILFHIFASFIFLISLCSKEKGKKKEAKKLKRDGFLSLVSQPRRLEGKIPWRRRRSLLATTHGTAIRKNLLIGDLDLYRARGPNPRGPRPPSVYLDPRHASRHRRSIFEFSLFLRVSLTIKNIKAFLLCCDIYINSVE